MNATWKTRLPLAVLAGLVLIALIVLASAQPVRAERDGAATPVQRYSVIETQAHNLIVTDNSTNILYFYTIDKDKEVGSDLQLRGSVDLNQVGKSTIKPTTAKAGQ